MGDKIINNAETINLNQINAGVSPTNPNIFDINQNNTEKKENDINLEKINISEGSPVEEQKKIDFEINTEELQKQKKHYHVKYWRIFSLSMVTIIISVIVSVFCHFYNNFIVNNLSEVDEENVYRFIQTAKDFFNTYTNGIFNTKHEYNLLGGSGKSELDNLISSDLNYIQKKSILKSNVSDLSNDIISNYTNLNTIKKDITKYGFFPKDLGNIISESESISSIQNSLVALESIKFSSAISVFSFLDTFNDSLSKSVGIEKGEIADSTKKVTERGERDINLYIRNCYLNPFENGYDCDYIGDFDRYYEIVGDNFNTKFFKELMRHIDTKLEQTEIPSFTISFKEFNQESNEITFDIEINTFKEDETELAKNGILSPHIFILNNLINNLRQSRFIIGKDISVKTIKVYPETITIGNSSFNVNNSTNTFTVRIKKENEIEIDDWVYADY